MNAIAATGRARPDRGFYLGAIIVLFAIVAAGFAKTYYLKLIFATPQLDWLVHVHAALMTAWFALFLVQASLIGLRRVDLHRPLGVFGAALAAAIVAVGPIVLVRAMTRELAAPTVDPFWFVIFGVDLMILLDFAVLVGLAVALRRKSEIHKRLMLLATAAILLPPLSRLPLGQVALFLLFYACVLVPITIDTIRHRRLHPAFGWGALSVLASQQAAAVGAQTDRWMDFTRWLLT